MQQGAEMQYYKCKRFFKEVSSRKVKCGLFKIISLQTVTRQSKRLGPYDNPSNNSIGYVINC
jgi:hypothetical protein